MSTSAQAFLSEHPPRFFDLTQGWALIIPDVPQQGVRQTLSFQTTTPYTVSPVETMALRLLLECAPGSSGRYSAARRLWNYCCASPPAP